MWEKVDIWLYSNSLWIQRMMFSHDLIQTHYPRDCSFRGTNITIWCSSHPIYPTWSRQTRQSFFAWLEEACRIFRIAADLGSKLGDIYIAWWGNYKPHFSSLLAEMESAESHSALSYLDWVDLAWLVLWVKQLLKRGKRGWRQGVSWWVFWRNLIFGWWSENSIQEKK